MNREKTLKNLKPFTKNHQPSSEARSRGRQKAKIRKEFKNEMFKKLFENPIISRNGEEVDTMNAAAEKIRFNLFSRESELTEKEKTDLMMKLFDFLAVKESNVNLETEHKHTAVFVIENR
jgi:hypothetical protein